MARRKNRKHSSALFKQRAEKKRPRRRKLKVLETIPVIGSEGNVYEVKVLENGKARCPCKGFRYRSQCRHLLDPEVRDVVLKHAPLRRDPKEVALLASMLATAIAPYCARVELVGSLRRKQRDVKDVDLIFQPGIWPTERVVGLFRTFGTPVHMGTTMGAIVLPSGVPAQLWAVEDEEVWGAALLHFIGPRDYNISLRIRANRRGWKLSQHGLVDRATGRMIAGKTEEDILKALDMPWLPASMRNDHRKNKVVGFGPKSRKARYPGKGF